MRTYRHQYRDDSPPFQLDSVFANSAMRERLRSCRVVASDETWAVSDHAPVAIDIDL